MTQGRNNMQMIDVLKRLAELDSVNPNVEPKLQSAPSLTVVKDPSLMESDSEVAVQECGMGAPVPSQPRTPASINMSASTGDELSQMLKTIMTLAGNDADSKHHEIELGAPHMIAPDQDSNLGGDISNMIDIITKNDDDSLNGDDEVDIIGGDDDEEKKEAYVNSPDPEIEPHDYGDKQVTPKPQGFKQRLGDNPYTPASESVEDYASKLLSEYRKFISEE